jgi:hypothetical protein
MGRACGCFGGNENCTRCSGSGYLDDRPLSFYGSSDSGSLSREPRPALGTLKRSDSAGRPDMWPPAPKDLQGPQLLPIGCLFCSSRFNSEERKEVHVTAEHVANADDSSEAAQAKPLVRVDGRIFVRRALARVKQQAIRMESQSQKAATQGENQRRLQKGLPGRSLSLPSMKKPPPASAKSSHIAQAGRAKPPLVLCPQCKPPTQVRADHLQKHIGRQHGPGEAAPIMATSTKPKSARILSTPQPPIRKLTKKIAAGGTSRYRALATGSGYSGPAHEDTDEKLSEIDNHWEERRLDGSRDYWQIREEGRFGSHPSYDDCDDESAP